jgi:hypothetical protein
MPITCNPTLAQMSTINTDDLFLKRKDALLKIAEAWKANGIRYGVAHGLDQYPAAIGRDVDVFVHSADRAHALDCMVDALSVSGFDVVVNKKPWAEWVVGYCQTKDGVLGIEIDIFSTMNWGWVPLVKDAGASSEPEQKAPFVLDAWGGFIKRVFMQVMSGNMGRFRSGEKHEHEFMIYEYERDAVCQRLPVLIGSRWAEAFMQAIDRKDKRWMEMCINKLRSQLLIRGLLHPGKMIHTACVWFRNELAIAVFPKPNAPVIELKGVDQIKLKLVAEKLASGLKKRFVFTSIEIQNSGTGNIGIRFLHRRRIRSSRLGLTLVISDSERIVQKGFFKFISPVDLELKIESAGEAALRSYEQTIIECFAQMNAPRRAV